LTFVLIAPVLFANKARIRQPSALQESQQ